MGPDRIVPCTPLQWEVEASTALTRRPHVGLALRISLDEACIQMLWLQHTPSDRRPEFKPWPLMEALAPLTCGASTASRYRNP